MLTPAPPKNNRNGNMAAKNEKKKTKDKTNTVGGATFMDLKRQLLDSITQSKPKVVKRLMDARVDPNSSNELGETPLIVACQLEDEEARSKIASLLLKRDACVNLQDMSGNTALSNAVKKVDENLVALFLEKGADVSLITGEGNTMLCCAAISGNAKITKLILREVLKQKLPVDHKNMHGLTPLLLAAQGGHIDVARILVKDGKASVTIRDLDNFMTAEQWMKHVGFHSSQEISFLSPRSRHSRKKGTMKSLFDHVTELESESSPDMFGINKFKQDRKQSTPPFTLPHILSKALPSHHLLQDDTTRSMFDLPLLNSCTSSLSPAATRRESKFNTEQIPGIRVSKHDVFSSSYLNKRKNIVERNKKSKYYSKGSLEPLSVDPPPPSLKRMDSITETEENGISRDTRQLPPLQK